MSLTNNPDEDISTQERTPLLHAPEKPQTPLPKLQITIIILVAFAEPMTSQVIMPFINQLISELEITGGDDSQVGYYAGLIISLFFLTEALTVLSWSRLSDHIGRKPVICVGLFGLGISMLFFGISRSFWTIVASRCLAGLLNGNIGVVKSMLGEMLDESNIAKGFAVMPVTFSIGATLGPLVGGTLARPYERFPIFHTAFWQTYPYLLPCIVSAAYSTFAFTVTVLFLKETNTNKSLFKKAEEPQIETGEEQHQDRPVSIRELFVPRVIISIANYGVLALLEIALLALWPLFFATSVKYGGLGLPPSTIGLLLGGFGLADGLFQAIFFPKIVKRYGVKSVFMAGMTSFIPIFLLFPVIHLLSQGSNGLTPFACIALIIQMFIAIIMDMSYGCIFVYMTYASPNKRSLGATNGLAQSVISILRAIGPAASTSLFAFSVSHNILGGYAVYIVLAVASGASLFLAARLHKDPGHKAV